MIRARDIFNVKVACALVAWGVVAGCAQPEKEKLPRVNTSGAHAVEMGQTVTLTAITENGKDDAYAWTSSASGIAAVSEAGVVTGITPGEALITVTGSTSKAAGTHAVVVTSPSSQVPFYEKWQGSAHADHTAEAFNHWNEEGEVPTTCARCHSAGGFVDYVGGDGTAAFQVDKAAPAGSVVGCVACHDPAASKLTEVRFPSGSVITELGPEARCMTCHQGRASGADVDTAVMKAGVQGDDTASDQLSFLNIHYYPAAATLFAGRAKGGYQYAGLQYDTRFRHVPGFDTCVGCHDPHSTRPRFDACVGCHPAATDVDGARDIRMMSSALRDYDGDGDLTEGVFYELSGLRQKLAAAITQYAREKQTPVCYDEKSHPYFFKDGNGDGACQADEVMSSNAFKSWTPRLLRAAYNYQMSIKDPGAFAHNAKYIMELLFDSTQDLNGALAAKVDLSRAARGDFGHFNGASPAARNWDKDETVTASCSRCHGASTGFRFFVEHGVSINVPETANGLDCATCHTSFGSTFDVLAVPSVTFPSGAVRMEPGNDNLCSTCHAGRASKKDIDAVIASGKLAFVNVHYLPAAGMKLGGAAIMGYQYPLATYAGPLTHTGGTQCTSCHDPRSSKHTFLIEDAWDASCRSCHADANGDPKLIRLRHRADYDGDGNVTETLAQEIAGMATKTFKAMQAAAGAGALCYSSAVYPYFFKDTDANGDVACSAAEAVATNRFAAWTPGLLKASHNFQISQKEPGAWAHNFDYMGQLLYDSAVDLSASPAGMTRP